VIAGAGCAAIVLAVQLPSHHLPRGSAVEDFVRDLFDTSPKGALVISHQWDVWLSGSLYLQEVEGLRRDIVVVNGDLLGRPWYLSELERRAPEVCARIRPEIERMIAVSQASREGAPERAAAYSALWRALVSRSLDRPVYVTGDEISRLALGDRAVPEGLAFRVTADSADVPQEFPRWRFEPDRAARDPDGAQTCELYARSALDRAYYEASRGRDDAAGYYLVLARSFDPGWRDEDLPAQPWGAGTTLRRSLAFFEALAGLDVPTLVRSARTPLPGSPTP
jgi:hypothetical protein